MELKYINFTLYGLHKHKEIIDGIICSIANVTTYDICFDIRLILTEALTNAFKHGNKNDDKKPIYVRCFYNRATIKLEIEDCGSALENKSLDEYFEPKDLLDEAGRGLFLIKSLADKIFVKNNILIVEKNLCAL